MATHLRLLLLDQILYAAQVLLFTSTTFQKIIIHRYQKMLWCRRCRARSMTCAGNKTILLINIMRIINIHISRHHMGITNIKASRNILRLVRCRASGLKLVNSRGPTITRDLITYIGIILTQKLWMDDQGIMKVMPELIFHMIVIPEVTDRLSRMQMSIHKKNITMTFPILVKLGTTTIKQPMGVVHRRSPASKTSQLPPVFTQTAQVCLSLWQGHSLKE